MDNDNYIKDKLDKVGYLYKYDLQKIFYKMTIKKKIFYIIFILFV